MARKSYAKSTYSIRLDDNVVKELQRRAKGEQATVGALIRRSIDNYLQDRDASEVVADMEERIIATIRKLDRHQLQTRRVADISVAQGEHIRRMLVARIAVAKAGEDKEQMLARTHDEFMRWLPNALDSTGEVRQMIRQVMEPAIRLEEAPNDPTGETGSEGVELSARAKEL